MTIVAVNPAAPAAEEEPGSWWLVLLGGLAGQAARVAEADRRQAALLATVSHDLRAPLAAAKAEANISASFRMSPIVARTIDGNLTARYRDYLAAAQALCRHSSDQCR